MRFDQLLKVVEARTFSLLDYGCGYGVLADYLATQGFEVDYYGYDILESAIETARQSVCAHLPWRAVPGSVANHAGVANEESPRI